MAAKFTKHGDQVNSLTEMQAMWYEIECGHAHLRKRAYGKVKLLLKQLSPVTLSLCSMGENSHDSQQSPAGLQACLAGKKMIPHASSRRMLDEIQEHLQWLRCMRQLVQHKLSQ